MLVETNAIKIYAVEESSNAASLEIVAAEVVVVVDDVDVLDDVNAV